MLAGIEEAESVLVGILLNAVAQAIVDVVHEVTLADRQYLVEGTTRMIAYSTGKLELLARAYLLFCQPYLIGKAELQLVAVASGLRRTENRATFGQRYLTDALQVVHHLLLLVSKLVLIGQNLPFATSAHAIMRAERLGSALALLVNEGAESLSIVMFLPRDAKVNHIARHHIRHKDH